MSQHYSNPKRADDPHALPDVETFYMPVTAFYEPDPDTWEAEYVQESTPEDCAGWYWWSCFPGCLPDSDPIGPFATEAEALTDAREGMEDGDDD